MPALTEDWWKEFRSMVSRGMLLLERHDVGCEPASISLRQSLCGRPDVVFRQCPGRRCLCLWRHRACLQRLRIHPFDNLVFFIALCIWNPCLRGRVGVSLRAWIWRGWRSDLFSPFFLSTPVLATVLVLRPFNCGSVMTTSGHSRGVGRPSVERRRWRFLCVL